MVFNSSEVDRFREISMGNTWKRATRIPVGRLIFAGEGFGDNRVATRLFDVPRRSVFLGRAATAEFKVQERLCVIL